MRKATLTDLFTLVNRSEYSDKTVCLSITTNRTSFSFHIFLWRGFAKTNHPWRPFESFIIHLEFPLLPAIPTVDKITNINIQYPCSPPESFNRTSVWLLRQYVYSCRTFFQKITSTTTSNGRLSFRDTS